MAHLITSSGASAATTDTLPAPAGGFLRSLTAALETPRAEWMIVGALTLLAVALRWTPLHVSLHDDELFLYAIVKDHSLGQVLSMVHDTEKTPPLGFVLPWLFAHGGDLTIPLRIPSLIAGIASVPLVYLLGRRTVGRAAATVGAAWFAISPYQIYYSTGARAYAEVAAFVILATLALLLALEKRRLRWWALYVVGATAAVYSHYIAALVLVPQAAWALWTHRESAREQLLAHAAVVVAFLPWLPSFVVQARHSDTEAAFIASIAPVNLSTIERLSTRPLYGHPVVFMKDLPGYFPEALILTALAVALVVTGYRWIAAGRAPSPPRAGGLLVLLAIFPFVALILYSLRPDHSFLLPRNLSVAVPYALLVIGWLLTRPPPMLATALSAVALAALGVGAVKIQDADNQPPDGRDAARFIDAHAPANAAYVDSEIVPFDQPPARGIRIYLERPHRIYPGSAAPAVWKAQARARAPVFVSLSLPQFAEVPVKPCGPPPAPYASQYQVVAEHVARGFFPIIVCGYAAR
jgi:4-amino-4-deoxy-L-arabinose transferase-like glycosyltransferase